jgi:hypothetical protein
VTQYLAHLERLAALEDLARRDREPDFKAARDLELR